MALQLTPALEHRLDQLAAGTDRSAADLAQEAVDEFCTSREEIMALVKMGDDDFARGEFLTHEEVCAHMEEILSAQ